MIKKRLFFKKKVIIQSSLNLIKYSKFYAGYIPTLTDTEIFKLDWKINLFDEKEEETICYINISVEAFTSTEILLLGNTKIITDIF